MSSLIRAGRRGLAMIAGSLLFFSVAYAQRFTAGAVVGRGLTGGFQDLTDIWARPGTSPGWPMETTRLRHWSPSGEWLGGAMVELRLREPWALEVNGLYRRLEGRTSIARLAGVLPGTGREEIFSMRTVSWQIPVLMKYRFGVGKYRMFVAGGPSFRVIGEGFSNHGLTAGAGWEFRWKGLNIAPAIRYTLWSADRRTGIMQTAPDQVEMLLTLSPDRTAAGRPLGGRVSLGVVAGSNLTGDYATIRTVPAPPHDRDYTFVSSSARNFFAGPSADIRLTERVTLEVSAFHRPINVRMEHFFAGGTSRYTIGRRTTWVFPVLPKYKIPLGGRWSLWLGAGPAFRLRAGFDDDISTHGASAIAGVEARAARVRIVPALRYTRWASHRHAIPDLRTNHLEGTVGFYF
jgi:hypothetical protein